MLSSIVLRIFWAALLVVDLTQANVHHIVVPAAPDNHHKGVVTKTVTVTPTVTHTITVTLIPSSSQHTDETPSKPSSAWVVRTKHSRSHGTTITATQSTKVGTTTAPPPPGQVETSCSAYTQCVDAINSCGKRYGGCFDTCKGPFTAQITPPPCP